MYKKLPVFILLLAFFGTAVTLNGQRYRKEKIKRFGAGLIGGITASQMDGDNYTGFDFKSPFAGIQATAFLSEYLSLDVNLLYVRKGANIENEGAGFRALERKDRTIHLSYAEVPILLRHRPEGQKSRLYLEAGISFNRIFDSKINERTDADTRVVYQDIEPQLRNNELASIIGIGAYLSKELSVGIRFSYGITRIYINENEEEKEPFNYETVDPVFFLRNYYLSANASYRIF